LVILPVIIDDIDQGNYGNQSCNASNNGIHVFHDVIFLAFNSVKERNINIKNQKRTHYRPNYEDKSRGQIE
jgi:hypothetical protein